MSAVTAGLQEGSSSHVSSEQGSKTNTQRAETLTDLNLVLRFKDMSLGHVKMYHLVF